MLDIDIDIKREFLYKNEADVLFTCLYEKIEWTGEREVNGKIIKIKRKMSYMSDSGSDYDYAGMKLKGKIWIEELFALKMLIEHKLNIGLNSVLLNLYENGKGEIRWHSDKEPQLGPKPIIPCLNLGATRKFWFMNKATGEKTYILVEHGDLLVMGPECQEKYLHAILKEKDVVRPRISLTYRKIIQ